MYGVKVIIGMHKFNICLVVVLLWCENTISPALVTAVALSIMSRDSFQTGEGQTCVLTMSPCSND